MKIKHIDGDKIPKDSAKAFDWYLNAAEHGRVDAQFNLGACYATGDGVTQDFTKAAKWFCKAAKQGDTEAQRKLQDLGQQYGGQ